MFPKNHQEVEARTFDWDARLRGKQCGGLRVGNNLERRKLDGSRLENKPVSLMLNDPPDGKFIHRWTKIFHDRDQREVLHVPIVRRI